MAKCVLVVTGAEVKEACGTEQLCGGLDAGIEGGVQVVRLLWQQYSQEEEWGLLLIDARNAFNEENHAAIMLEVCYEWPSGARLSFN